MNKLKISLLSFLLVALNLYAEEYPSNETPLRLWYNNPAKIWEASVPLGNGRLGAMPDGGIVKEKIVLNEISLWSGSPQDADMKDAHLSLPKIQEHLLKGENIEAQKLMDKYFKCEGVGSGLGQGANVPYGSFQVLANLNIEYNYGKTVADSDAKDYLRELLLNTAIAKTEFKIDNTSYKREYITSFGNDVIVIRLTADKKKKINFSLSLDRPERFTVSNQGKQLVMQGQLNSGVADKEGMKYFCKVEIKPEGGNLVSVNNTLSLEGADAATIYISATTDYKKENIEKETQRLLEQALKVPYTKEREKHISNYRSLFTRSQLTIDGSDRSDIPTDERLHRFAQSKDDNGLINLYYQYGRYLIIGSTRDGLLAPNLQGLWANEIDTPWNGDYHLNINIQMNQWPMEVTNLGVLNEPFYTLAKGLLPAGEKTAKAYYNADGWVAHTITNLWGYTSPGEHYSWGSYNTGSAWICQTLWSHYEFTKDKEYLKQIYPILKGSSEFYLNTMIREPKNNWLVTAPSNSPENGFYLPNGQVAHVCMGPTIDNQIIRFLLKSTLEASGECDNDLNFQKELEEAITSLPPNQIGSDGRLMEWLEEYKEAEPHHRHISHLWGLYPGDEINSNTPELLEASRASLIARGDNATGWSSAWKINCWARLKDGEKAFKLLQTLLSPVLDLNLYSSESDQKTFGGKSGSYPNLFCAHPPFQIDGNYGGTAGIAEMLIQSHEGYISLLPAIPSGWGNGKLSGICVRGGGEVDLNWKNGKIESLTLKATIDNDFKIQMPTKNFKFIKDGSTTNKLSENLLSLTLMKDEIVTIKFINE